MRRAYEYIHEGMIRQERGFMLLETMLKKEFETICSREAQAVTSLELSIHELLRQLALERDQVISLLAGQKLTAYAAALPADEGQPLQDLADKLIKREQVCAKQASHNAELVLALLDQGTGMLDFMQKQLCPKKQNCYTAKGRYSGSASEARIINGSL